MASLDSAWISFALGVPICTILLLGSHYAAAQTGTAPRIASICVPCHGLDGIGHDVEIPNIAGQHSSYLRNQLMAFKKRECKHQEMRSIAPALTKPPRSGHRMGSLFPSLILLAARIT